MDTDDWIDFCKKQFCEYGNCPRMWELKAGDLLAAGRILKQARNSCDVFKLLQNEPFPDGARVLFPELMLVGLAIECLLKALWLRNGKSLFSDGGYKKIPSTNDHSLLQLADANSVRFTDEQRDALRRLSMIIQWAGRYPAGKKWTGEDMSNRAYWSVPRDDEYCESILLQINELLIAVGSAG